MYKWLKQLFIGWFGSKYSGDPKTGHVRNSNGQHGHSETGPFENRTFFSLDRCIYDFIGLTLAQARASVRQLVIITQRKKKKGWMERDRTLKCDRLSFISGNCNVSAPFAVLFLTCLLMNIVGARQKIKNQLIFFIKKGKLKFVYFAYENKNVRFKLASIHRYHESP